MENETINRTIHEFLGKCVHQMETLRPGAYFTHGQKCTKCGAFEDWGVPNYTNDKNLHLVREAEVKVVEKYGEVRYGEELAKNTTGFSDYCRIALAPARTRCEAIIALLEEMEDGKNN